MVPLLQYPVASLPGGPAADSGFGRPTRSDLATAARAISCDRAEDELTFDVLSDVGNHTARRFGLVYALPEELRAALRSNNKALPGINGDESGSCRYPRHM